MINELEQQYLKQLGLIFESDLMPMLRMYKAAERGLNPEFKDAWESALLLKKYYEEYLKWYNTVYFKQQHDTEDFNRNIKLRNIYNERLIELNNALSLANRFKDKALPQLITAVDNAINQWHIDYPVIQHFAMEEEADEKYLGIADQVEEILFRLRRLPKESPYS